MFKIQINDSLDVRLIELNHANDLYVLIEKNRERLKEWFDWTDKVQNETDAKNYIHYVKGHIGKIGFMHASIWEHDKMIGVISHQNYKASNHSISIGYWLDIDSEGKGIMTDVVKAMTSYAFYQGLNKVEIFCAVGNSKSSRIPEKLNFTKEGLIRSAERLHGKYIDNYVYGMLAHEWE